MDDSGLRKSQPCMADNVSPELESETPIRDLKRRGFEHVQKLTWEKNAKKPSPPTMTGANVVIS